mmetsp:Transcript_85983/g.248204  ORF Transcript_85983/g.248204 Transcript_85983/m.248204 type:complete len:223 (-) Transcript_85983:442-1110(-)
MAAALTRTAASSEGGAYFFVLGLKVHSAMRSASTFRASSSTSLPSRLFAVSRLKPSLSYFALTFALCSSNRCRFCSSTAAREFACTAGAMGNAFTSRLMTSGSGTSRGFGRVRLKGFGEVPRFSFTAPEEEPLACMPVALNSISSTTGRSSSAWLCSLPMTSSSMYLTSYTLHHSTFTHRSNSPTSSAYLRSANRDVAVPYPEFSICLISATPSSSRRKNNK